MTDIPVPTLDQITGRTVMEKMRTLAKSFIEFANEIKDNVYTEEEVREYVTSVLLNYYTKEEVDEAIASIDLSDFYTKLETDGMLALKRNIADSYTKSETDGMLALKRNISDSYDKTEIDAKDTALGNRINTKQDILTAISPIEINENNISLKGWEIYNGLDWSRFNEIVGNSRIMKEDILLYANYNPHKAIWYIPKGIDMDSTGDLHGFMDDAYNVGQVYTVDFYKLFNLTYDNTNYIEGAIHYHRIAATKYGSGIGNYYTLYLGDITNFGAFKRTSFDDYGFILLRRV